MVNLLIRQGASGIQGTLEAYDQFGYSLGAGDFDGDGRDDLAVGVPFEDILFNGTNQINAGAVNVLYGSSSGPTGDSDDFWYQGKVLRTVPLPGMPSRVIDTILGEPQGIYSSNFFWTDKFGSSLAVGDFDGDGFADLAVGVLYDREASSGGSVNVIYGSSSGLSYSGDQLWNQNTGLEGASESDDEFSRSLTVGDFNGDGRDDLVVGVPGESLLLGGVNRLFAGAVNVIYGTDSGLRSVGDQIWHQASPGVLEAGELGDRFGSSVVAGDFNGDGIDDLAIGAPFEDLDNNTIDDAGVVNILYGSNNKLTTLGNQIWHQNSPGIIGLSQENERFGEALAVGDFDGDGRDDLAIGVPRDAGTGSVNIIYGSVNGLTSARNRVFYQDGTDIQGEAESSDFFGSSLAVGDFNGDGRDDLAIGVPGDRVDGIRAGAVNVIYGSSNGLTTIGDQVWHQNVQGIVGDLESGDNFGFSLGVGDYNGDGYSDLAIGAPTDSISGLDNAGAVNIIFGSATGLVA